MKSNVELMLTFFKQVRVNLIEITVHVINENRNS